MSLLVLVVVGCASQQGYQRPAALGVIQSAWDLRIGQIQQGYSGYIHTWGYHPKKQKLVGLIRENQQLIAKINDQWLLMRNNPDPRGEKALVASLREFTVQSAAMIQRGGITADSQYRLIMEQVNWLSGFIAGQLRRMD
jgi:hypothetical protein